MHQSVRAEFIAFGNELPFFDNSECFEYRVSRDKYSLKKKKWEGGKKKKSEVHALRELNLLMEKPALLSLH